MDDLQRELLKNKIGQDLERVSSNVEDMGKSLNEVASEWLLSTAQAQLLCQFYTGLESVFEKGLKLLDALPPSKGDQHHKDVLNAAQTANLYPETCHALMLDLLGFRHFSRHGYGMILRPGEVEKKTESVVAEWPNISQHVVTVLSLEKLPPEESTNDGTK